MISNCLPITRGIQLLTIYKLPNWPFEEMYNNSTTLANVDNPTYVGATIRDCVDMQPLVIANTAIIIIGQASLLKTTGKVPRGCTLHNANSGTNTKRITLSIGITIPGLGCKIEKKQLTDQKLRKSRADGKLEKTRPTAERERVHQATQNKTGIYRQHI